MGLMKRYEGKQRRRQQYQGYDRPPPRVDLIVLKERLAGEVDRIVQELLPQAQMTRRHWIVGSTAGEPGQSLRVFRQPKGKNLAGHWRDFAGNEGGDLLDLINAVRFGGSSNMSEAIKLGANLVGLRADIPAEELQRQREECRKRAQARALDERRLNEKRRRLAQGLFLSSLEVKQGDPVWRYLEGRGLDLSLLPKPPGSLRYHPEILHPETGELMPAMIAAVRDTTGEYRGNIAVHRTYLTVDPDGRVTKAVGVDEAKLALGPYAGGVIPLSKGASGKAWGQAPQNDLVLIGEGIEDCLTAALAVPEARVVAAISISNYQNIVPPAGTIVTLLDQDDPELGKDGRPHATIAAKTAAIEAWQRHGNLVRRLDAKALGAKDLNDLVNGGMA